MTLTIDTRFTFSVDQPTDLLLQFEVAAMDDQATTDVATEIAPTLELRRVAAEDAIGERIWLRAEGEIEVAYRARVAVTRTAGDLGSCTQVAPHDLPGEAIHYLLDSRYCPADQFQPFVEAEFGHLAGGARIAAMRDWVAGAFTYEPGSSGPETGAVETFISRRGVCRDFAHVMATLARASTIPARYVACYARGVTPPDFHAVIEVFLADPGAADGAGCWHIVDATGMAEAADTAIIGVGRDAADVSFMTSFGPSTFLSSTVQVTKE